MRFIDIFDQGAALAPERAFLLGAQSRLSYRETRDLSHRIANAFRAAGVAPGTHAAIYCPNDVTGFACVIGIIRAGCVWVAVNILNTEDDTVHILNETDSRVLFFHGDYTDAVGRIRDACPKIAHFVCIDRETDLAPSLAQWIAGQPDRAPEIPYSRDDPVAVLTSGGTTGKPKGILKSHLNLEMSALTVSLYAPCANPVFLAAVPLTHGAGGFVLALLGLATTNVVLPRFDAGEVLRSIQEHRVTHLFLPPTAIYALLAHEDARKYDYSSLKYFLYAAAPMSVDKLKQAIDVFGPVMCQYYALTESGYWLTYFSAEDHVRALNAGREDLLASCGKVAVGTRLEIMDDDGNLLGAGETGGIVVDTNLRMIGYYNDPEETAAAFAHGWLHTGDIGYRDEDGWVFIVDRKKNMLISGGFNIYPSEIERVIHAHPAVNECAVVGVPDDKWGEAVKAIVELKSGETLDEEGMKAFCRDRLSRVKVPKSIEFWPELPRTPAGKVAKKDIRAKFWEGRVRAI